MKGRIRRPETEVNRLPFPRVGSIKVGMKSDKGYPKSVDYFIPAGKYAGMFTNVYGDKPQTIQIIFPDDDPGKVCNERYEYRDDSGQLVAEGDGEIFKVWDGKNYQNLSTKDYPDLMKSIAKRFPNKLFAKNGDGWKISLTLNFVIPMVKGIAGVWTFTTNGSASTIPAIRSIFDKMLEERGYCKGIVFDLSVKFATTQKPGDKSRYPVVSLIPNESAENIEKIKNVLNPKKELDK